MLKEDDIVYQRGPYWVLKVKHGYEVYKDGFTHATRVAIVGYKYQDGLNRAIQECDRRYTEDKNNSK